MLTGNVLVAQGGGPTAVVNCSLVGVIEEAKRARAKKSVKIIGALHSLDGIFNEKLVDLGKETSSSLQRLCFTPGAALGSCRRKMQENDYSCIIEKFKKYDIHYLFYIGGNGSMHTAHKLDELARSLGYDLSVIGIPKTIDNDLAFTDHSPGFGSAARYFASITRDIGIDVESLPPPVSVIETLGRNTGWLTAASSLAKKKESDAPHLIYFPEKVFSLEQFLADVERTYTKLGRVVVVVSEGVKDNTGAYLGGVRSEASRDGFGRTLPGGAASFLAEKISERLKLRARNEKPGLAARTSVYYASSVDQKEAYMVGKMAVRFATKKQTGVMITLEREKGKTYRCHAGMALLKNVAMEEKFLPSNFINSKGNFVTESFIRYCQPLIGEPIQSFPTLRRYLLNHREE